MSSFIALDGFAGAAFVIAGAVILEAGATVPTAGVAGLAGVVLDCAKPLKLASDSATAVKASPRHRLNVNIVFISVSVPGF
jgi:membrane-bound ClpP family serine protease